MKEKDLKIREATVMDVLEAVQGMSEVFNGRF